MAQRQGNFIFFSGCSELIVGINDLSLFKELLGAT